MKIVVLGTRGFPNVQGGVEKHAEHLYPELAKLDCQVTVIAREPYVGDKPFTYRGVDILPLKCPHQKFFEAIIHTFKGIFKAKVIKADIVHVHAIGPALLVPLARLLGLKVVFTHHGPDYERKKWNKFVRMILKHGEWRGCRFSHEVISVSKYIGEGIEERFQRKVHVIPNGVEIPKIAGYEDSLKQYGLEKGKYILFVGRFVPEKGLHDLVRSWEIGVGRMEGKLQTLNSELQTDWKLVIIGDADHEDAYSKGLKSQAARHKDIILTGRLSGEPLHEIYSHAGLFVLPSYYEGLPIVLLEAMSYGLSCIVSDIPANREVDLSEDRYFRAGDVAGLTAKLGEFIGKPLDREEKSRQIEYIRGNFDWAEIAKRTWEVYQLVQSL